MKIIFKIHSVCIYLFNVINSNKNYEFNYFLLILKGILYKYLIEKELLNDVNKNIFYTYDEITKAFKKVEFDENEKENENEKNFLN